MKIRSNVDYSTKDYEGFRTDLIELLKRKIPEYTDFSQSDVGIVLIELLSHGLDVLSYYNEKVANEVYLSTALERENVVRICNLIGYTLNPSIPSQVRQLFEITPQEEDLVIRRGTKLKTENTTVEESIIFELTEDLTIPKGKTGLEKDSNGNYLYLADLVQGYTITDESLGQSSGTQFQQFKLGYMPVIANTIEVMIDEGSGYKKWDRVDNFIDSDSTARTFRVITNEAEETSIEFGNGTSGKIPNKYADIKVTYRVGGGTIGNVGINTITEMEQPLAIVKRTFNPEEPYVVGVDIENIESAKVKAPANLRTLWRAVTEKDYSDVAITRPDIRLASAKEGEDRHSVYVYVLPKDSETLSEPFREELTKFYHERKEIGYDVFVNGPTYIYADLKVTVQVYPNYTALDIKQTVTDHIKVAMELGQLDFGEELSKPQLTCDIMHFDGVRGVEITSTSRLTPTYKEILRLRNLEVVVQGGR